MKSSIAAIASLLLHAYALPLSSEQKFGRYSQAKDVRQLNPSSETNCGLQPCSSFDTQDQLVDVRPGTIHEFRAPLPTDLRGPCPGLNALANHNFISRNGVTTMEQAINGTYSGLGMGKDIASMAAAYAIVMDGDVLSQSFSIGGPYPGVVSNLLKGKQPAGLSYSHNRFESDGSMTRGDAYLNGGDAHSLQVAKFEHLYGLASDFTPAQFREQFFWTTQQSVANNPEFFRSPFGTFITPGSHAFAVNGYSNHSASQPNGYLDGEMLKSFLAISGEPGSFTWEKGMERIPLNWYRRPSATPYNLADIIADISYAYMQEPSSFMLGGNTGKVNSFVGVDIDALTGGTYDEANLFQGNNFGCFALQLMQAALPSYLATLLSDITPAMALINEMTASVLSPLSCPQLAYYNATMFSSSPGLAYSPAGTDQPY